MPAPAVRLGWISQPSEPSVAPLQQTYVAAPDFPSTALLDDFNRADSADLGPSWLSADGRALGQSGGRHFTIAGAQTFTLGNSGTGGAAWNNSFLADQECWTSVSTLPVAGFSIRLAVRNIAPTSADGYQLAVQPNTHVWSLQKTVAGVITVLGAVSYPVQAGDAIGLRVVGTRLRAFYQRSGDAWREVLGLDDSTYAGGGWLGFEVSENTTQLESFGGGSITPAPITLPFPPPGAINNPISPNMRLFPSPLPFLAGLPTFPVSSALDLSYEALQGIAGLDDDPWEALGAIAATKSDPWEALVGGIVATSNEPWEALLKVAAVASEAYEGLGGIAATKPDPWEALVGGITATRSDAWEALRKIAGVANPASYEALLGLRAYTDMSGLVQEFYDDFSTLDTSLRWVQDLGTGTIAATGGVLRLTCAHGAVARLSTIPRYRSGGFQFRLATGPDDISDGVGSTFIAEWKQGHFGFQIERTGAGQRRFFAYAVNGGTPYVNVGSYPVWWRVRYDLELRVIVFETSDDAVTWTTRLTETNIGVREDPFGSDPLLASNQFSFEYDNDTVGATATKFVEVDDLTLWGAGSLPQIDANQGLAKTTSEPWEAIVSIAANRSDPYEANLGIATTKSDAWEALLGLSATKSDAYETLRALAATSSDPWEALLAIAATRADAWEANLGLAATRLDPLEALGGLAATRSDPHEALFALSATRSDPYEALLRLAAVAADPFEALLGIAKTGSDPWEAIGFVSSTRSAPWEALRALTASGVATYEALAGLAATARNPYEALQGLAATRQDPYEALKALAASSSDPWESLVRVAAAASDSWESNLGISASRSDPFEALGGLAATRSDPWESLASLVASGADPVEALRGISASAAEAYEALQGLSGTRSDPWEAGGGISVSATASLPWDALQGITASRGEPYEALARIAATRSDAYEALARLAASSGLPIEALLRLAATRSDPWETLAVARFSVGNTASLPWDALAGIGAIGALPWEAGGTRPIGGHGGSGMSDETYRRLLKRLGALREEMSDEEVALSVAALRALGLL